LILARLLLAVTVGSSIWVLFDAPRHGLARAWSVGCLFVWVAFFPTYLIARAEAGAPEKGPVSPDPGTRRGIAAWVSRSRLLRNRWALAALVVGTPLTLFALWDLRLVFRGPYMLFLVRHPALVSIPLLAGGLAFVAHTAFKLARRALRRRAAAGPGRRSRKRGVRVRAPEPQKGGPRRDPRRYTLTEFVHGGGWRGRGRRTPPLLFGPAINGLMCATIGFVFAVFVTSSWTGDAIYRHTDYRALALESLRSSEARIKPYEVARRQSQNGLNSPTERPTNLHIVKVDGELHWTSVRDPDGLFRVLTKPTRGVMSVTATSTAPDVRQAGPRYDADFRYGPGMRISESVRWQVYKKKCYSCDVAEMTGVPTAEGPVVIAPYIRYKGNWFVRRPTFGGVYLVHADGRIDDLSPTEAARNALVRESGRLFPEKLARRIADAYKFKRGIWNRLFVHTDQLEVADTENNRQPFLQDFRQLGPQWVTTLKPRGRTFTTAGVMTTDAVTGETRLWLPRRGQSLIGNQRALDIVRGESFPGIDFADDHSSDPGGKFRVVEPRQVFPGGRLHFLLSIIPNAANRVTMSVIVDAESQRVTAKFPATPEGDADLVSYLRTERLADDDEPETPMPKTDRPPGTDPVTAIRRVLSQNREEQRRAAGRLSDLKAQELDLLRVLEAAKRRR
jgi:hypothetical protein